MEDQDGSYFDTTKFVDKIRVRWTC